MKYYLIGIKGAGMSALALILNDLGYTVVGYDDMKEHAFTEDKLIERGIKIYTDDNNEIDESTIIVRSTAIKEDHKEIVKANKLDLKIYEYNQMLGKLANMFDLITVAGCHGKTTTTSLMAHVLGNISGCNYLIGDGHGHASKDVKKFVIEACEYCRHFLVYEPDYAIITNIDLDHVDYFKDMQDVIDAYQEYANKAEKMIIACGDDPYTRMLDVNKPLFFYGIGDDNDIVAKNVEYTSEGTNFDVFVEDNYYGHFELPIFGKHMVLNTLAVIGVCYYERYDAREVCKNLKSFKGASRRFNEEKINDTIIIDDYAHHPGEVKVTIKAAQQKYPNKKIIAVFQPHTFSRTEEFTEDLVKVLNKADASYVLNIFPAREKQEDYPNITSKNIIDKLDNGHLITDDTWEQLKQYKDAVVIFMSPKEIHNIMENYKEYLRN
ncbi:MAG: UDP-N-acetylmuramate--L-alanine ligase [Bacilli bacterium]